MMVGLQLVAEGRTETIKGHEEASFYLGSKDAPIAIMTYGEIPEYLDETFWSAYEIWDNTRLTKSLPLDPVWGNNPKRLIDIIVAFQSRYDVIRG